MLGNHVRKVGTQRENSQYEVTGLGRAWDRGYIRQPSTGRLGLGLL